MRKLPRESTRFYTLFRKICIFPVILLCAQSLLAQPAISSLSPSSGTAGSTVIISGNNFNATPSNNIVYFGTARAIVVTASTTSLSVTVPANALYQPISVTTNGLTAYSPKPFILTFPGGGGITGNSFAKKIDSSTGQSPYQVAMGDLDGDGKSDLVEVNGGYPYSVSVFRNTSSSDIVSFAPKQDFQAGYVPFDVGIADLNGDGKLDLVIVNSGFSSNNIYVLNNTSSQGSISFSLAGTFGTGAYPTSVATGDLDGDGRTDIAIANFGSKTISVFKNSGTGTAFSFDQKMDFDVDSLPTKILINDIDGDGKPDLVVSNEGSHNISVFRNTGSPGNIKFLSKLDFPISLSGGIAMGDLDGDGKPDLIVPDEVNSRISVLRNLSVPGTVSFDIKKDIQDSFPKSITIADLDGDGKPDIATENNSSPNSISVIRNTSVAGSMSFGQASYFTTGMSPYNIIAGDLNGDGKPDLVTPNMDDNTISIFINTVNGTRIEKFTPILGGDSTLMTITGNHFSGASYVGVGGTPVHSFTVVSDSVITAIVGPGSSGNVIVATPGGTATLAAFQFFPRPTITSFNPLTGDAGATIQIIGTNFTGTTSVKFGGEAVQSFTVVSSTQISVILGYNSSGNVSVTTPGGTASLAGFNYTGTPPVITGFTPKSGPVGSIVTIQGSGFNPAVANNIVYFGPVKAPVVSASSTSLQITVPTGTTFQPLSVTSNRLTAYSANPFSVTFADSGKAFNANSFGDQVDLPAGISPEGICAGDLDGDGRPDLIVAYNGNTNANGHDISIFRNTGSIGHIAFAPNVDYPGTSFTWFTGVATGDINGDGKLDVVACSTGEEVAHIYINNSTGGTITMANPVKFVIGSGAQNISVADLDGDGKPDIVVSDRDWNALSVLRNTSTIDSISFDPQIVLSTGYSPMGVAIGDLDGDGKPDLSVANDGVYSHNSSVFRNTSTPGNISFTVKTDYVSVPNAYPKNTFIGDVNGDGKPELLVSNYNDNTASVFQNQSTPGNIILGNRTDFPWGKQEVHLANMDGDGKPDLLMTNGPGVSLLRNLSTADVISFDTVNYYLNGTGSSTNFEGDLDGDGKSDLAVVNVNAGTISILRNQIGDGPLPSITHFTPDTAFAGQTISITGTHLTGTKSVSFGGVPARSFSALSDTSIQAVVANGASGKVFVSTLAGPATDTGFVYTGPTINSFSPALGYYGSTVTIKGAHLLGTTAVQFGGSSAISFRIVSDSIITAVVGSGNTGEVSVISPNGDATFGGFLYSQVPVITSFYPTSGSSGTTVAINGIHFTGVYAVTFGDKNAASFTVVADTLITAVVGAGSSGSVNVFTPTSFNYLNGFTYISSGSQLPVITSFKPDSGTTGTTITITGKYFTGTRSVSFGGAPEQSFMVSNDSVIQAVVGTGATGNIVVTTNNGADTASGFRFSPYPTGVTQIFNFTPASGKIGTDIQITGRNFRGTTSVFFGTIPAASFTIVSDTLINAVVGIGSSGSVFVMGTNGSDSLPGFTYVPDTVVSQFQLLQFSGTLLGNQVLLHWQTLHENNMAIYLLESSVDSVSYNPVGSVHAINNSGLNNYELIDSGFTEKKKYYKLSITDSAGNISFSNVLTLYGQSTENNGQIKIYPNPAAGYVVTQYPLSFFTSTITLVDYSGRIVQTQQMPPGTTQTTMYFTGSVKGMFNLAWTDGTKTISQPLFIK